MHNSFRLLLLAMLFVLLGMNAYSQKSGDYRSVVSGNWNEISTWQILTDSGWQTPTILQGVPRVNAGIIHIQADTKILITDSVTIDQLEVDAKATLILTDSAHLWIPNGAGSDLIIEGIFENSGDLKIDGNVSLQTYGIYRHKNLHAFSPLSIASHPYAIIEFSGGGPVDWITIDPETILPRLCIINNTSLNLSNKSSGTILLKNNLDTDLTIAAGSSLKIGTGIKKLLTEKKVYAKIDGTLINQSVIEIPDESVLFEFRGRLINEGSLNGSNATGLIFSEASVYEHKQDGGRIPFAKWSAKSNCILSGLLEKLPEGMDQSLGNVSFESAISKDLVLKNSLDCSGNLTIANTGGGSSIILNRDSTHHSILVGGDFVLKSGNLKLVDFTGTASLQVGGNFYQSGGVLILKSAAGSAEVYIAGNLSHDEGTIQYNTPDTFSNKGIATITVIRDFRHNGGTTNFSSNSGEGSLYAAGNFIVAGGILTETGSGRGKIHFNGRTVQLFDASGGIQKDIDVFADSLCFLQMANANSKITGTGKVVLYAGSTIGLKNPTALVNAPVLNGHFLTPVRIYQSGINVILNGSVPQYTGDGFSGIIPASVTVDNPTKVSQSTILTVKGTFSIVQGELISRKMGLIVKGNWINNGSYNSGNISLVTFSGSEQQKIAGTNPSTFYDLTIDNPGGVKLDNNISVSSQLSLVNGILDVGSHVLSFGIKADPVKADSLSNQKMIALGETGEIRKEAFDPLQAGFYYPIGNISDNQKFFSPIRISFTGGTFRGYSSVSVVNKKHPLNPESENYLNRYWTVNQQGFKGFTASVIAVFDPTDVRGITENLRLGKYSHELSDSAWISFPEPPKGNTFTADRITSFSDFTGLGVHEIAKSNARKAAAVQEARADMRTGGPATMKLYPNPVKGRNLQLALNNFQSGQYELLITNSLGQKIFQQQFKHAGGSVMLNLKLASEQPAGIYHLRIIGTGENYLSSFVKE